MRGRERSRLAVICGSAAASRRSPVAPRVELARRPARVAASAPAMPSHAPRRASRAYHPAAPGTGGRADSRDLAHPLPGRDTWRSVARRAWRLGQPAERARGHRRARSRESSSDGRGRGAKPRGDADSGDGPRRGPLRLRLPRARRATNPRATSRNLVRLGTFARSPRPAADDPSALVARERSRRAQTPRTTTIGPRVSSARWTLAVARDVARREASTAARACERDGDASPSTRRRPTRPTGPRRGSGDATGGTAGEVEARGVHRPLGRETRRRRAGATLIAPRARAAPPSSSRPRAHGRSTTPRREGAAASVRVVHRRPAFASAARARPPRCRPWNPHEFHRGHEEFREGRGVERHLGARTTRTFGRAPEGARANRRRTTAGARAGASSPSTPPPPRVPAARGPSRALRRSTALRWRGAARRRWPARTGSGTGGEDVLDGASAAIPRGGRPRSRVVRARASSVVASARRPRSAPRGSLPVARRPRTADSPRVDAANSGAARVRRRHRARPRPRPRLRGRVRTIERPRAHLERRRRVVVDDGDAASASTRRVGATPTTSSTPPPPRTARRAEHGAVALDPGRSSCGRRHHPTAPRRRRDRRRDARPPRPRGGRRRRWARRGLSPRPRARPRHLDARLRVASPARRDVRLRVHEPAVVLPRGGGDVPQLHARGHGRERALANRASHTSTRTSPRSPGRGTRARGASRAREPSTPTSRSTIPAPGRGRRRRDRETPRRPR